MRYWRSPLSGGGYRYARTQGVGRADRLNAAGDEWVTDDVLWSEIHNTGNWDPATPDEVESLEQLAAAAAPLS